MRAIRAIGYDMDYTLIHYHVEEWERRSYEYLKQHFLSDGWPVEGLQFDPTFVCRGLIIDTENGNLIKANRFGFIKRAMHGTHLMSFEGHRELYSRTLIDLADSRWVFLNTLFSLSEGCMYCQLVDLLDKRAIPEILGYEDLYERVKRVLDAAHMEGRLKAEIIAAPEKYVILEEETPLALLDQHCAGKKLILITNSEWNYTHPMMTYAFDRFLPAGKTWRDLFDLIIVGARKPYFFTISQPFFEIVNQEGLLKPHAGKLQNGKVYLGGTAQELEKNLKLSGDEILYVGDHMFGDVHVTKNVLRWRTALILRELEDELQAIEQFRSSKERLMSLMKKKQEWEEKLNSRKLEIQRKKNLYNLKGHISDEQLERELTEARHALENLDKEIAPLARMDTELSHPLWGLLMRAGNDKSYLAYQVERYADIYTSRVSNFLWTTPFAYLRSPRGSLPHDSGHGF
ncbi:MAG: HAD-IG family 5'-nucleotidase [Chlamydiia bacterium]|nr:HAD-IG family 5'-nucleotidase [Chlamydiia bacterium]